MTDFGTLFTELGNLFHRHFPSPPPAPAPPPVAQPSSATVVIQAVGAACPVYDTEGNRYDMSGMLASGASTITNLLKEGVTAEKIEGYLIGLIKGYPADQTPGGLSYMNGWQQAIGKDHSWDTTMKDALQPKAGTVPTPQPPVNPGAGPGIG